MIFFWNLGQAVSGDEISGPGAYVPQSPRPTMIAGDAGKRW